MVTVVTLAAATAVVVNTGGWDWGCIWFDNVVVVQLLLLEVLEVTVLDAGATLLLGFRGEIGGAAFEVDTLKQRERKIIHKQTIEKYE